MNPWWRNNMKRNLCLSGHIQRKGVKHFSTLPPPPLAPLQPRANYIYYDFSCKNVSPYHAWIINIGQNSLLLSLSELGVFFALDFLRSSMENLFLLTKHFFMQFGDNFSRDETLDDMWTWKTFFSICV